MCENSIYFGRILHLQFRSRRANDEALKQFSQILNYAFYLFIYLFMVFRSRVRDVPLSSVMLRTGPVCVNIILTGRPSLHRLLLCSVWAVSAAAADPAYVSILTSHLSPRRLLLCSLWAVSAAAVEVVAAVDPARELAPEPSPPRSVIDSAISRLQLSLEELQHLKRGLGGPEPEPDPGQVTVTAPPPPAGHASTSTCSSGAGGRPDPAHPHQVGVTIATQRTSCETAAGMYPQVAPVWPLHVLVYP